MNTINNKNIIYVLLPAFNEKKALEKLIPAIAAALKSNFHIIVIDDGSDDKTDELCKKYGGKYPLKYISHEENLGLGRALKTGIKHVLNNSAQNDMLVIMDADNTHSPELIKTMMMETSSDIIIASRYLEGAKQVGLKKLRRFLSFSVNKIMSALFRVRGVKDYTSGYEVISKSKISDISEFMINAKSAMIIELKK